MSYNLSLQEIQYRYFELVEKYFSELKRKSEKNNLDPIQAAESFSKDSSVDFSKIIPDFIEEINQFWGNYEEIARSHIENNNSFKAVFGSSLFSDHTNNIASPVGLYMDTVILPDPFFKYDLVSQVSSEDRACYFIRMALNVLSYQKLATTDVNPPIVIILPDKFGRDHEYSEYLQNYSIPDVIKHISIMFGENLSSKEETEDFISRLKDPNLVINSLVKSEKLLFDLDWYMPKEDQIIKMYNDYYKGLPYFQNGFHAGHVVLFNSHGRITQANDVLLKAHTLGGNPIIDAPTSWKYLSWIYEYRAMKFNPQDTQNVCLIKALQHISENEMTWLNPIPEEELINLRRSGELQEIRKLFTKTIHKIDSVGLSKFKSVSTSLVNEIKRSLKDYNKDMENLKGLNRDFIGGVRNWTCIAPLEIAAIAGEIPLLGLIGIFTLNQFVDFPKFKNLSKKYKEIKDTKEKISKSPASIFIRIKTR